ncbi:MAG: hypothetical protein JF587_11260 [Catenulisporales bacterium]|nr:hypothetical protein [Catenulisporales bacterium]
MPVPTRRALAAVAAACLTVAALAGCGGSAKSSAPRNVPPSSLSQDGMDMNGMNGMDGMNMNGSGDDMPGMGQPSGPKIAAATPADNGLHAGLGGYSYVADTAMLPAASAAPFTFHITGPSGKTVTRFQPYEAQLLVFYIVRSDLADFHQLTATMREDGTWTVPMPALAAGSYRTYVTFAAPDSSAGTPLSYSLSQPLTVSGNATAAPLPAGNDTVTADGYTLHLTGSPRHGTDTDLGVTVTKNGQPVKQFDRILDGYAHLTAFHSGDAAFVRALSTGRSAGGPSGAGALTAKILFPQSGTWRLFVQFDTAGAEHTAAFTVDVP